MICSIFVTSSVRPEEILICKGTNMKTISQFESQSLLPADGRAVIACIGNLLTAFGSLLQEHPDLHAELSPNTSQTLITIGEKLHKASHAASV